MLKYAYRLGVEKAIKDAGLEKSAGAAEVYGPALAGAGLGGLGGLPFGKGGEGARTGAVTGFGGAAGYTLGELVSMALRSRPGAMGSLGKAAPAIGAGAGGLGALSYMLSK